MFFILFEFLVVELLGRLFCYILGVENPWKSIKSNAKVIKNRMRFGMDLGRLLDRFGMDFGSKLGGKLQPTWDQNRKNDGTKTMSRKWLKKLIWGGILGPIKQKQVIGGYDLRSGWNCKFARIGKDWQELAWYLSRQTPAGAPDPVALRAIPATVPGLLGWLVECLVNCLAVGCQHPPKWGPHAPTQ